MARNRTTRWARMKGKKPSTAAASGSPPRVERRAISLPPSLMLQADAALFELRKQKRRVSFSALVEVALIELLARGDLDGTLRRHGATARRRG